MGSSPTMKHKGFISVLWERSRTGIGTGFRPLGGNTVRVRVSPLLLDRFINKVNAERLMHKVNSGKG